MAKKQTIKAGLFQKTSAPTLTTPTTTPTAATPTLQAEPVFNPSDRRLKPRTAKVRPVSVSLTVGEYDDIDQIAGTVDATRMAIMNAAIRHTLTLYHAGKAKLKSETRGGRVLVKFE